MHLLEANRCKPRPIFLPSSLGRIFCVFHEPVGEVNRLGNLLVVPGFNEEMNRCRSMVTLLARELAVKGVGTLVIDLYGTGESDGEYGDARWDAWLEDIGQAMAWLDGQTGGCLALLGIRLGFPLAVAAMANDQRERALIGWQPVIDGKSYFTQFMRMKIAANMDRTDIPRESTGDMRARLDSGNSIEIAGYEIHPELAMAIESFRLAESIPPEYARVAWFEKEAGAERTLSPASTKVIDGWCLAGRAAQAISFEGPAFWALHERFLAPDLVNKTSEWLLQLGPRR